MEKVTNPPEYFGALSSIRTTTGRRRYEEDYDNEGVRTVLSIDPFVRDVGKILASKAFRRLSDKAQVVVNPKNPHTRNRITHTAEVVACAMRIAEILGLNTNLVQAISWGHDVGHVPFGHVGEEYISRRTSKPFKHEIMGVVIAQRVERHGRGLNLTHEVLSGMYQHGGGLKVSDGMTPEARVVRIADKIAYLTADFNDLWRFHYTPSSELNSLVNSFGENQRKRVATLTDALCRESAQRGNVQFSDSDEAKRFGRLRELMYEAYVKVCSQNPSRVLGPVYDFLESQKSFDPALALSLMTDHDVIRLSGTPLLSASDLYDTALGDLMDFLPDLRVDCCNPDLDW